MLRKLFVLAIVTLLFVGCGGGNNATSTNNETSTATSTTENKSENMTSASEAPSNSKGVGPISELQIPETIDEALATKGENIFKSKCLACHKMDSRMVGPPLKGITQRRTPEWIMNMILNPKEMLEKDETAKKVLEEYKTPMTFQDVTQEEARALLEYFRKYDSAS